jgi:hypothetical protein
MEDAIEQSAREIIERRGAGAIDWLNERIRQLETAGDRPALDTTYRILPAVERMLSEGGGR